MDRQKIGRVVRSPLYPRMASPRCGCGNGDMSCGIPGGNPMQGCGFESPYGCKFPSLAMVYPAPQAWENVYSPEKALQRGTAFAGLDLPFAGGKGCCK